MIGKYVRWLMVVAIGATVLTFGAQVRAESSNSSTGTTHADLSKARDTVTRITPAEVHESTGAAKSNPVGQRADEYHRPAANTVKTIVPPPPSSK